MNRLINLTVIFFLGWVAQLVAADSIDYFDITQPKFKPLSVIISMQPANHVSGLYVQSVFQSNLEQTLFFRVFEKHSILADNNLDLLTRSEVRDAAFIVDLIIQQTELMRLSYKIYSRNGGEPLYEGDLYQKTKQDLRKLGIRLANTFVKVSLGFEGIADSKIAYTAQKKHGRKNINISSYDGTRQQRFSYNLGSNNHASWSFDNRHLLYTTFTISHAQVAIQPAQRLREKSILSFPDGIQPQGGSWSPSGKSILITLMTKGNSDLYSYDLRTRNLEKIIGWKSLETSPVLSPDGSSLVFVSDSAKFQRPQIYIHNMKTRKTQRITFRGKYNSSPRWSPDGSQIIYEGKRKGFFQIFKYTLATNRHLQLTFGRFNSENPDWSPNAKQIVFSSNREGSPKLFLTSVHGGGMIRLTTNPKSVTETNPVWSK